MEGQDQKGAAKQNCDGLRDSTWSCSSAQASLMFEALISFCRCVLTPQRISAGYLREVAESSDDRRIGFEETVNDLL